MHSAEPSANSAHRGEITKSLTVEPDERGGDEPANTMVRACETPHRITTVERQSALQSSNAAAEIEQENNCKVVNEIEN
jgi:hypothetical protein